MGLLLEFCSAMKRYLLPVLAAILSFSLVGCVGFERKCGDWIYTGSTIEEGNFLAEGEGSIIAIYLDHIAMFNMIRDGADIDERWGANGNAIPEVGTKGKLILKPAKKTVTE